MFEAALTDAARGLVGTARGTAVEDIAEDVEALDRFLTTSPAGLAYRALVGEAQHDEQVARLLESTGLFDRSVHTILTRAIARGELAPEVSFAAATAILTGPAFFRALTSEPTGAARRSRPSTADWAAALLVAIGQLGEERAEP